MNLTVFWQSTEFQPIDLDKIPSKNMLDLATMKNTIECDRQCELHLYVNYQIKISASCAKAHRVRKQCHFVS